MIRVYREDDGLTPTGRVPVEHRQFGFDRRTIGPALFAVAVAVIWLWVIPGINSLLSYDQTTDAGDVFQLAPAITMEAQEGWGIENGERTKEKPRQGLIGSPVVLHKGGVAFQVETGPYKGEAEALLGQIDKVSEATESSEAFNIVDGARQGFQTNDGGSGIAQGYTTIGGAGVVAALVLEDTGIKITATGPENTLDEDVSEIEEMIESISLDPDATKGGGR